MNDRPTMSDREARHRFTHAGLDCALIDSKIGFVNGYVRLPEDHVARTCGYDQINRTVSVHGGLTYGVDKDGWVGFDTGHSGDYWPGMDSHRFIGPAERTWDLERLTVEVETLAEQLATMTEIAPPTSSWDCTENEFETLLRDAMAWRVQQAEVSA